MSTTQLTVSLQMSGREVFTTSEAPSATNEDQRTLAAAGNNVQATLKGTTTPKVDQPIVSLAITLDGAGEYVLDLTSAPALALPAGASRTVDLTGKKLVAYALRAKEDNAADIQIDGSVSNAYVFLTANTFLLKKGWRQMGAVTSLASEMPAVSSSAKIIHFKGTAADVVYADFYFGTP